MAEEQNSPVNYFNVGLDSIKEATKSVVETGTEFVTKIFDGENQHDTEEPSEISQDDRDKLKPYIFGTPKTFEYPMKVGDSTSEYQPHSVRFYINARENSRVAGLTNAKAGSLRTNWGPYLPEFQRNKQLEENPNRTDQNNLTAEQARTISTVASGVAAIGIGAALVGGKPNLPGALVFGTAGIAGAAAVVETTRTLRTLGVIELYISAPPTAQYSANWENKELGALAGLATNKDISSDSSFSDILSKATGLGELGLRSGIKAAANLPSDFGIAGEIGAAFDLASGKVANPYKEQLFSNMGFRQFAFNYKFNPRNKTELDHVEQIIRMFKYHMHPENDPTGLFLEYPSEFNIEYLYRGEENTHLSKVSTCALTDVKITYGNQDAFTTIKDTKGAPAEINMQLAFTELETLTNDRIADGY